MAFDAIAYERANARCPLPEIDATFPPMDGAAMDDDAPSATLQARALEIVVAAENGDVGKPYESGAIAIWRALSLEDAAEWARLRLRLKKAGVGLTALLKEINKGQDNGNDDPAVADKLIRLARGICDFAHTANGEAFASFEVNGVRQTFAVKSKGFAEFLSYAYYKESDRAPAESALTVALNTLKGQAVFEGDEVKVYTRIAKTDDGAYWLDLANDRWQAVRITERGWQIVDSHDAPMFTRTASMQALPEPRRGGNLDELWPLVNVPEDERLMVLAWLLECLRPDTPHAVLELVGEQGSAKSSTQRALRRLIDPNQSDLRSAPKSADDLWIAAANAHVVSLENLSHLSENFQDTFCTLTTGGGFATRTLYTNSEETILDLRKPVCLNGIACCVTRQDLLDRTIHVELPAVQQRELAAEMSARFEAAQPRLLGALFDLFATTLRELPHVQIDKDERPRMVDFARLGEAVARALGQPAGTFLTLYTNKRHDAVLRTVDATAVGAALQAYLEARRSFNGTLTELLHQLERYRPQGEQGWPRSAKGLGDALRRLAPALRMLGYEVRPGDKIGGNIRWNIFFRGGESLKPSPASPASPGAQLQTPSAAGHAGLAGHGFDKLPAEKIKSPAAAELAAVADIDDGEVF